MALRKNVGAIVRERRKLIDYGDTRLRFFSAADERLTKNANAQGLVIKVEHRGATGTIRSTMLTGDCDAQTWSEGILKDYGKNDVKTNILMAAHHGSISFFDEPSEEKYYYVQHIETMSPEMTVISVGVIAHGHPDTNAVELYKANSSGSKQGNKVFTTQEKGTLRLTLADGSWKLKAM